MSAKLLTILAIVLFVAGGCIKADQPDPCIPKTVESEMAAMTKFAADSSITTTQDGSGLLYQIIEPGTGAVPGPQSSVTVNYIGRTLNGVKFDENFTGTNNKFVLNSVIKAWQIALPKIKEGGKIKFITPSAHAYPCNPYVPVALNNQPLYFYVELKSVQ